MEDKDQLLVSAPKNQTRGKMVTLENLDDILEQLTVQFETLLGALDAEDRQIEQQAWRNVSRLYGLAHHAIVTGHTGRLIRSSKNGG